MQGCAAHDLAVEVKADDQLLNLSSFACWLRTHAAFVSSITAGVRDSWPDGSDSQAWLLYLEAAQYFMQRALQLAPPPLNLASAAKHLTALQQQNNQRQQQQQQQQQRLQLRSFTSGLAGAKVLAALPADSLTRLELHFRSMKAADGPPTSAALARLSSLQQLILHGPRQHPPMPSSCLAGVAVLSRLTSLELDGLWLNLDKPLNTALAAPGLLQLQQLHVTDRCAVVLMQLTQLTQLTELSINVNTNHPRRVQLPAQLQRLQIKPAMEAPALEAILQLQQLQYLSMKVHSKRCQPLLQFEQLPALQHMQLFYDNTRVAAGTARVWRQLKQLKQLEIDTSCDVSSKRQFVAVVRGLSGCASLTKLVFKPSLFFLGEFGIDDGEEEEDDEGDNEEVAAGEEEAADAVEELQQLDVFGRIAGLTGLQDLYLDIISDSPEGFPFVPGSALTLSALTSLTRLVLRECGTGVDDGAAAAMASSCTLLQHLDLQGCNLVKTLCAEAFKQLRQLTELCLDPEEYAWARRWHGDSWSDG